MKRLLLHSLLFLIAFAQTTPALASAAFSVSSGDKSPPTIVIASNAPPAERYAAQELQRYVERITTLKLPIVEDSVR